MSRTGDRANRRRGGFALPRLLVAGLLFVVARTPHTLLAQADKAKAPLPSNRYLLMVETSRSMQRRADGVRQTVQDLLKSGLAGQLRRGDTLGVWTYNESLYAGRFPLQTWSPETQEDVMLRTLTFLKEQKYEKQASFDKVLPALSRVIKGSPFITIILISSPDEKIHGTPFDNRINGFYQEWHEAQQKARMPFVTVLRGQDGQLADFTVNTPPWPVQMPRRSQEAQIAEAPQTEHLEAVRTAPAPTAPPLIISGKKAQPEAAPAPTPEPSGASVQAPAPAPQATSGSKSFVVNPPGPAAQPAQIAKMEAAPTVPEQASPDAATTTPPVTIPVPAPKGEVVQAPEAKPVMPAPATPEAPPAPQSPVSGAKPVAPELPKPAPESKPAAAPTSVTEPKAGVVNGPETSPVAPTPAKAEAAAALPNPTAERVRAIRAAQEVLPEPSTNAATAASAAPPSSPPSPPPPPRGVAPAQTATAVPAETLVRRTSIWIAGLVLAGTVISFVFVLRRRARAAPGASLITQSFERKNKP
ncbi:MAG: hypothetical protein ACLQU3_09835 [Limisphaerales bacterium]